METSKSLTLQQTPKQRTFSKPCKNWKTQLRKKRFWVEWVTWVGRMAVSRAERRWSKEPRIETTSSVMVWLLSRDALIAEAFSLSKSPLATAITIFSSSSEIFFFCFWILIWICSFANTETIESWNGKHRHLRRLLSPVLRTLSVLDFRWNFNFHALWRLPPLFIHGRKNKN